MAGFGMAEMAEEAMELASVYGSKWRVRDVAEEMLSQRSKCINENKASISKAQQQQLLVRYASTNFDVDTCLARLRRDKASVVRNAFEAAAITLLEKLENSTDDDGDNVSVKDDQLPPVLHDHVSIGKLHAIAMERAHDNKDPSKRKNFGKDGSATISNSSQNGASKNSSTIKSSLASKKKGSTSLESNNDDSKVSGATSKTKKSTSASSTSNAGGGGSAAKTKDGPKFTRNTPASSAAALDARLTNSRAILCTAANVAFNTLTPPLPGHDVDVADVPQNPNRENNANNDSSTIAPKPATTSSVVNNMGAVVIEARTVGQRVESVASNAARRSAKRYEYRKQNLRQQEQQQLQPNGNGKTIFLKVSNPFAWKEPTRANNKKKKKQKRRKLTHGSYETDETDDEEHDDDDDSEDSDDGGLISRSNDDDSVSGNGYKNNDPFLYDHNHTFHPSEESLTECWANACLPRMMAVLHTGAGHAVYHDVHWATRHGRIANLLEELAREDKNYGLHLIVTTEPEVPRFAQEFRGVNSHVRLVSSCSTSEALRALTYAGGREERTKLRKHFPSATGLPDAPFHVVITSYMSFLQDYLHFCQTPFEVVVMDDGVSWMSAAQGDPNSPLGMIWENAIWSKSDQQIGLAGTCHKEWDYSIDSFQGEEHEELLKEAWIGLTTRHRLVTSSIMKIHQRNSIDLVPVSGLVNFVAPHYADIVREEWDRSRITTDAASMEHFRKLLTRSIVVHNPNNNSKDMYKVALEALQGDLPDPDRSNDPEVPELMSDESFISEGKLAFSRRATLQWLGHPEESWIRYELGISKFQHIVDVMKVSGVFGHLCEEIVTSSSTTSSGATGQVTGTSAYKMAVRCGRQFGSEQGLRQHNSAFHAPPGTWLCRTCSSDCVTSQARTHHERSCGQPSSGAAGGDNGNNGGTSSGGPGSAKGGRQQHGPAGTVGKKKGGRSGANQAGAAGPDEKDPDGSFRVPGYRGVWVNKAGKHFVKIEGERLPTQDGTDTWYFDNIDEAAKKHDEALKEKKGSKKAEYNFKADGSRIVYEDVSTSSTTGLGGSASSVVPALSVINIKDLPPDVKPLLRDPRQTSRTGGNSKRHVYAYRGVCRQARKGHDRWQSQISFMGVNHYLGTFDSEWDAAAIYAWAHLILYGEEATKKAQKEGEEAAAAYEQEKRDIAAGKVPVAPPKPEKKKRKPTKKKAEETSTEAGETEKPAKKKRATKEDTTEKKTKVTIKVDKETLAPILAKAIGKAPVLAPRDSYKDMSDLELAQNVATRLKAARRNNYYTTEISIPAPVKHEFRPCTPYSSTISSNPAGAVMLLGLSCALFGWDVQAFVAAHYLEAEEEATAVLSTEYGHGGLNERFRTVVCGTVTVIGNASLRTQRAYESLGLGTIPIGGAVGTVDCNIGGRTDSCSEAAASIRYAPTPFGDFQFAALSEEDVVTMNGLRITPEMGSFPLFNEDVCTIGARVFVFLMPSDK